MRVLNTNKAPTLMFHAHHSQVRLSPHLKTVNAEPDVELYTAQDEEVFQKAINFLFRLKKAKQTL